MWWFTGKISERSKKKRSLFRYLIFDLLYLLGLKSLSQPQKYRLGKVLNAWGFFSSISLSGCKISSIFDANSSNSEIVVLPNHTLNYFKPNPNSDLLRDFEQVNKNKLERTIAMLKIRFWITASLVLFFYSLSFLTTPLFAQSCSLSTISTQAEIDNFATNFPGCTSISGDLNVEGYGSSITDLSGLSQITSVGGDLLVQGTDALSLSGLENITSVGGNVGIYFNNALPSLAGLTQLSSIGGYLAVVNNTDLTDLTGLNSLTSTSEIFIQENPDLLNLNGLTGISSLSGGLFIKENPVLASLSGLDNLASVGTYLGLDGNVKLTSIAALGSLTSIGTDLFIDSMLALSSLAPLSSLTTLGGSIFIEKNPLLTSLSGLSGLIGVSGDLYIGENAGLTTLSGLDNVLGILGNLYIDTNPLLANLTGLSGLLGIDGDLQIIGNSSLSNLAALSSLVYLGSSVFIDGNPLLGNLTGLGGVSSVPGDFFLNNNIGLTNVSALIGLTSIGGYLNVTAHPLLTSLSGLNNLASVGTDLYFQDNDLVSELDGLASLDFDALDIILIQDNASLTDCAIQNVCDHLGGGATSNTFILNNAGGCNSIAEIENDCLASGFLPVEWLGFDATPTASGVQLEWATAIEVNNHGFEVMRSSDGNSWETLDFIEGQGNSQTIHRYRHLDSSPLTGRSLYRLRQVDLNGAYSFSNVLTVDFTSASAPLVEAFPNPSHGPISLRTPRDGQVFLTITDITGRTVLTDSFVGQTEVDLSDQPLGVYYLQVQIGQESSSQRIIKQR